MPLTSKWRRRLAAAALVIGTAALTLGCQVERSPSMDPPDEAPRQAQILAEDALGRRLPAAFDLKLRTVEAVRDYVEVRLSFSTARSPEEATREMASLADDEGWQELTVHCLDPVAGRYGIRAVKAFDGWTGSVSVRVHPADLSDGARGYVVLSTPRQDGPWSEPDKRAPDLSCLAPRPLG